MLIVLDMAGIRNITQYRIIYSRVQMSFTIFSATRIHGALETNPTHMNDQACARIQMRQ